jgi:hypothetical protein
MFITIYELLTILITLFTLYFWRQSNQSSPLHISERNLTEGQVTGRANPIGSAAAGPAGLSLKGLKLKARLSLVLRPRIPSTETVRSLEAFRIYLRSC